MLHFYFHSVSQKLSKPLDQLGYKIQGKKDFTTVSEQHPSYHEVFFLLSFSFPLCVRFFLNLIPSVREVVHVIVVDL